MLNTIFLQAAEDSADTANQGAGMMNLLFIIGIIVVFYFFMIRPQKKQQQKIEEERNNLREGDTVVTTGGLYGKIEGVHTATDKNGKTYATSFVIKLKPDYQTRVEVSKDCVFKDVADMANAEANKK